MSLTPQSGCRFVLPQAARGGLLSRGVPRTVLRTSQAASRARSRLIVGQPDLGLTEKRVRNAIRALEAVGFLDRAVASGSRYKATEDGLRRKPIQFCFGADYAREFMEANRRAEAARGARSPSRREARARLIRRARLWPFLRLVARGPKPAKRLRQCLWARLAKRSAFPREPLSQTHNWRPPWSG